MDQIAREIVTKYIQEHLDKSDEKPDFGVYTVANTFTFLNFVLNFITSNYKG